MKYNSYPGEWRTSALKDFAYILIGCSMFILSLRVLNESKNNANLVAIESVVPFLENISNTAQVGDACYLNVIDPSLVLLFYTDEDGQVVTKGVPAINFIDDLIIEMPGNCNSDVGLTLPVINEDIADRRVPEDVEPYLVMTIKVGDEEKP